MSLKIDRLQLEIVINNDQARKSLRSLEDESRKLTSEMKKLDSTTVEYAQKATRLKSIKVQMDNIYQSIGLTNLSLKELKNRQNEVNMILARMSPSMQGYKELQVQSNAISARLKELRGNTAATGSSINNMAGGFQRYFAMAAGGIASFAAIGIALGKAKDAFNSFQEKLGEVSALTGVNGEQLIQLGEDAKTMSVSTVAGGIKIKESATEILDAFKLMGSAKPELLKDSEALEQVTQDAIILAAASKGELAPSVEALANTMNQFGAGADESRRYINAMAAGAKEGAAEIPDLSASIIKFGAAAASANISVEESVGLIETLAEKGVKGELAGTGLKGVLLKLQSGAQDTNPALVGMITALDNLAAKHLSAAQMVKKFGLENYIAAEILVTNRERFGALTTAVTGTNVAMEQAAINTDNNNTKLAQAENRITLVAIELGEKLAPAYNDSANALASFLERLMTAPAFIARNQILIISLAGALLAYNAALIKSTALKAIDFVWNNNLIAQLIRNTIVLNVMVAAKKLKAIWTAEETVVTKLATTAQYGWNAAVAANPLGPIIIGIMALVGAIKMYDANNAESIRLEKEKADAMSALDKASVDLQAGYDIQTKKIAELNKLSLIEKQDLLDKANGYLNLAEAQRTYAIEKQHEIEQSNTKTTVWQGVKNAFLSGAYPGAAIAMNAKDAVLNGIEASGELTDGITKLNGKIKQLSDQKAGLNEIIGAENIADKIVGKGGAKLIGAQLEEKQRYYTMALKNYVKDSAEYIRIAKKLSAVNKQLEVDSSAGASGSDKAKTAMDKLNEAIAKKNALLEAQIIAGNTKGADATAKELAKLLAEKGHVEGLIEAHKKLLLVRTGETTIKAMASKGAPILTGTGAKGTLPGSNKQTAKEKKVAEDQWAADEAAKGYADLAEKKKEFEAEAINTGKELLMIASNSMYDHEMKLMNAKYDSEEGRLKKMLDNKAISQQDYDTKVAALAIKRHKAETDIARKAAIREKAIAVIGIGVGLAKAIAQITMQAGILLSNPITAAYGPVALAQIPWVVGTAALQAGLIMAQPLPQYFRGKYKITGQDDGKQYNAPWTGPAKTGLYTRPALFAETGSEIMIDPATTKNIQMNYPGIMDAINFARVPQYAAGKYNGPAPSANAGRNSPQIDIAVMKENTMAMKEHTAMMKQMVKDGVRGKWSLMELEKIQKDKSTILSATEM